MSASESELKAILKSSYSTFFEATNSNKDEESKISLAFYTEFVPVAWYSMSPIKFHSSNDSGSTKYTPPTGNEFLLYTYTKSAIPALRIKSEHVGEYRIAWPEDLGYHITPNAELQVDGVPIQKIDTHWMLDHSQFLMKPGFEHNHDRDVGNCPTMLEWSSSLPSYTTHPYQPWFYCRRTETALPLFKFSSMSTICHIYSTNLDISKLLRMQVLRGDVWESTFTDLSVIDGLPNGGNLTTPELWGMFAKIRENEILFHKTCGAEDGGIANKIYIEDVITADSENDMTYGQTITSKLVTNGPLCRAIFWKAENVEATGLNNLSNYTTNTDNLKLGEDPIGSNSLMYGTAHKFKEMSSEHFVSSLIKYHFTSSPRRPGYHAFPFCYAVGAIGIDVGSPLGELGAILSCKLEDPNKDKHKATNNTKVPRFILRCRMLVIREMEIIDGKVQFTC